MTEDVLHRALAQRHPQLEGEVGGVDLLVTFLMQEPAPSEVLLWLAADPLQADGSEQAGPGGRVVVRDVSLPLPLHVPPVALLLNLLLCLVLNLVINLVINPVISLVLNHLLEIVYRQLSVIGFLMEWKYYKNVNSAVPHSHLKEIFAFTVLNSEIFQFVNFPNYLTSTFLENSEPAVGWGCSDGGESSVSLEVPDETAGMIA